MRILIKRHSDDINSMATAYDNDLYIAHKAVYATLEWVTYNRTHESLHDLIEGLCEAEDRYLEETGGELV